MSEIADGLRQRLHHQVIDDLGPVLGDASIPMAQRRQQVIDLLEAAVLAEKAPLTASEHDAVVTAVVDDVFGFGPIDPLLADPAVTEVMCNGPHSVWVEKGGKVEQAGVSFADAEHLRRVIDKMVSAVGRRVDESSPLCDARMADGARINAVLPPVAVGGPFLTIRRFSAQWLTIDDLCAAGALDGPVAMFLQACVQGRRNIVISGGTGSGKTTLLNALSAFIGASERIVTIEDAKELRLHQQHVVALEARPPNLEQRGEVTIRDLVRNSLRMRPDRIVVGEVRSGEALDMLQAMNTGHTGSLTTIHANTPRDALARLETLVLMAGYDLPVRAIREQVASAVDVVVQVSRFGDATRGVAQVTEVQGMEGDVVVTADLFSRTVPHGGGGPLSGVLRPCGVRPRLVRDLAEAGISLPADLFDPGVR